MESGFYSTYFIMPRAVASGVKGGDNCRGPWLSGGPRRSQPTGWGQPKKDDQDSWRATAVSHHESLIITRVFKPCQFQRLKEFKTFKHKIQKSCVQCTWREPSHRQQNRTELFFASSCTWTNKHKLQFKHANRKRCERAHFSTSAVFCAHRAFASQSAWTPN